MRSQIAQAVRELADPSSEHLIGIEIWIFYNARFTENQNSKLRAETVYDLVIELSSPLTAYLGRIKGRD